VIYLTITLVKKCSTWHKKFIVVSETGSQTKIYQKANVVENLKITILLFL